MRLMFILLAVAASADALRAAPAPRFAAVSTLAAAAHDPATGPPMTADARWAKGLLWGLAGLVVAAALLGPWLRSNLPDAPPPTWSHDEPPGTSGRHGRSGTYDPTAPDRHR